MIIQTIELDCAPGFVRPGDLIHAVVKGTPAEVQLREPVSKVFGCWTWTFPDLTPDEWKATQLVTAPRIRDLHERHIIRYGSW